MRDLISILFITLLLTGCITAKPQNNADFGEVETIKDLEGIYQNKGEGGSGQSTKYLSSLIWPNDPTVHDVEVETIEVRMSSKDTLKVKALRKDGIEKEGIFVKGKDFEIRSGKIVLKFGAGIAGFKGGEPLVGPYYESVELGLDKNGNGKYRQEFATAGLAFLFLPIAMGTNDEVRFNKISN
ncbi:MAG: hypothetical protein ACHQUC_09650 [Chlamydiales bacterium]